MQAEAQTTVTMQQLIPSSTFLIQKLTVSDLDQKFPECCDTRHFSLSQAILTQSAFFFPISKNFINHLNAELNPMCHLLELVGAHPIFHVSRLRVNIIPLCTMKSSNFSPSVRFSHQNPASMSLLPNACHMPRPSHPPGFCHANNIWMGMLQQTVCLGKDEEGDGFR